MTVPIIVALVGALAVGAGVLAYRHQRAERPYAKALRALAKADGAQPLVPAVTTTFRHGARAERLHRVRTASTAAIGVLALAVLAAPTHRLATGALAIAVILRVVYELLVQAKLSNRAH